MGDEEEERRRFWFEAKCLNMAVAIQKSNN